MGALKCDLPNYRHDSGNRTEQEAQITFVHATLEDAFEIRLAATDRLILVLRSGPVPRATRRSPNWFDDPEIITFRLIAFPLGVLEPAT